MVKRLRFFNFHLLHVPQETLQYQIIIMTDSQMVMVDSECGAERARNGSVTEASSTASDSPTPTNSVQDKNWAHWHGPSNKLLILT